MHGCHPIQYVIAAQQGIPPCRDQAGGSKPRTLGTGQGGHQVIGTAHIEHAALQVGEGVGEPSLPTGRQQRGDEVLRI